MRVVWGIAAATVCVIGLVACGNSGETTVIKEVQATPPAARETASRSSSAAKRPSARVPDVVGLPLDTAEKRLEQAGYEAAATNTDTTFGIVVASHFTVCSQDDAKGKLVPVLAQKYGC